MISTLAERGDVAGAFREAVSAMKGTRPGMSREEKILATIACHSAVKLGDKLSHEEMKALIKEWLTSRYPATCPHGRSICYRIDHKDIARKVDRHQIVCEDWRTQVNRINACFRVPFYVYSATDVTRSPGRNLHGKAQVPEVRSGRTGTVAPSPPFTSSSSEEIGWFPVGVDPTR